MYIFITLLIIILIFFFEYINLDTSISMKQAFMYHMYIRMRHVACICYVLRCDVLCLLIDDALRCMTAAWYLRLSPSPHTSTSIFHINNNSNIH